jgi:hypothetical protein
MDNAGPPPHFDARRANILRSWAERKVGFSAGDCWSLETRSVDWSVDRSAAYEAALSRLGSCVNVRDQPDPTVVYDESGPRRAGDA